MYWEKMGKKVTMFHFLSLERTVRGSSSARCGSDSFRCVQISWRHCGVMLPVRWACSSILGKRLVKAAFAFMTTSGYVWAMFSWKRASTWRESTSRRSHAKTLLSQPSIVPIVRFFKPTYLQGELRPASKT